MLYKVKRRCELSKFFLQKKNFPECSSRLCVRERDNELFAIAHSADIRLIPPKWPRRETIGRSGGEGKKNCVDSQSRTIFPR